jgi:radical SAM protein with 4Fe4S-binding SPASM domain
MPGSYERVMVTARRFLDLRERHSHFSFYFNATVNELNWRELPALAAHVEEQFHTFLDFNLLTGNPRDAAVGLPSPEETAATIDAIYAARKTSPLPASLTKVYRDVLLRTKTEGRQVVPCRAGSLIALIDANGDVRSCPLLPVLGNLRNQSFREIWQSPAAKAQHQSIVRGDCTCDNNCYIISSLNHCWRLPFFMLRQRFGGMRSAP